MGVLYQNGITITKAGNLKEVLNKVLGSAMKLTEAPAGSIALIDGDEMVMAAHRGLSREFFKEQRWKPRKEGLTYYILSSNEPVEFKNTEKEPLFKGTEILQAGDKIIACIPAST